MIKGTVCGKPQLIILAAALATLCMVIALLTVCPIVEAQDNPLLGAEVEEAVLSQDWARVLSLLPPDSTLDTFPKDRLIKAHASLALNRNNESLCLFLSVTSAEDLKNWRQWAGRFAERNPSNVIAQYFLGDAHARLEQWDSALVAFDKGLELNSNHALILIARGVTEAANGGWDTALLDLTRATRVEDPPADAYASLGAHFIKRGNAALGAEEYFNKALEISPGFALALNGRGCARFAKGHWDEAKEDFEAAGRNCECIPMALLNAYTLAIADLSCRLPEDDSLTDKEAQMSLQRLHTMGRIAMQNVRIAANTWGQAFYGTLSTANLRASASANWSATGPSASATISAQPNWQSLHNTVTNMSQQNLVTQYHALHQLHTQYQSLPPGGVVAEMRQKYVDAGNWLDTWTGLFYRVKSMEVAQQIQDDSE